ncbi:MAG: hypothetical protein BroJett024_38530 [Alphaproteobacteria bacterium]|nr:MAG: hypothetical protein BroJett024_38530 [Alphaproteobacteria bacterium]
MRRRPGRSAHHGLLEVDGRVFACVLGRAGIAATKREGDGATPRGDHAVLAGWGRRDRLPIAPPFATLRPITAADGWCDDPRHPAYNRPVRLPFRASHEVMHRDDRLYDIVLILDWNCRRRARSRGSAIFAHVAPPAMGPTAGCIGAEPAVMAFLLRRLRRHTVARVLA